MNDNLWICDQEDVFSLLMQTRSEKMGEEWAMNVTLLKFFL